MKLLIAEDSATLRSLLAIQLADWQFEIYEAKDGAEAWEKFQRSPFPLVLTDWIMPNLDGVELIRRIRSADVPFYVYIVLLTAKSEKEDLVYAMEAGADDFLVKPCDDDELRVRLREGMRILQLQQSLAEKNSALRHAQAALIQNEKLSSLGQLAAGMAHEINNPIAYVGNNLTVLRRDVSSLMEILQAYREYRPLIGQADAGALTRLDELEQQHELDWIQENIPALLTSSTGGLARVRDIVKNLRDFAHVDEAEFDRVLVTETIESTLGMLQHLMDQKEISVHRNYTAKPRIECRPAKISQVLHNVLLNAIQASSRGGEITVSVSETEDAAEIEIDDCGAGMNDKTIERAFEPFFTTRPVGQGAGLGLSLCYGVMQDHHGSIDIDSKVDEGTHVRLKMPKCQTVDRPHRDENCQDLSKGD